LTHRASALRYSKSHRLDDPYVVAGRRTYLIGTQDGRFPDMGDHLRHEMGGMWSHPIKVLDGFWLGLGDSLAGARWLPPAERFETSPVSARHIYPAVSGFAVERETWVPHDEEALVISYTFRRAVPQAGPKAPRPAAPERAGAPAAEPAENAAPGAGGTLPVVLLFRTDLQGVWLSERLGWTDGPDQAFILPHGLVHARDSEMPFHAAIGPVPEDETAVQRIEIGHDLWGPEKTHGQGISIAFFACLPLAPDGRASLTFVVSSSCQTEDEALATWRRVAPHTGALQARKAEEMSRLLAHSRLQVPDPEIQALFDDIKVGYEQLYRDVPSLGKGLGAGLPEYPWWFGCDNTYALLGALCVGRLEMARHTLRLLARVSREHNGDGRIVHEVTTNGVVYNPGNAQETAHFAMAVWETFCWTGDLEFLRELYPLCRQGVLDWLFRSQDSDGDLLPEGYGITEIAGLNWELIDTAVYGQRALAALAEMARVLQDPATEQEASRLADRLARAIDDRFWLEEEGLYADLIAPPRIMLPRLEAMRAEPGYQSPGMAERLDEIERICRESDAGRELPWLFKTWVIFCPLEVGLSGRERAERALRRMESSEFTGLFGVYLSGYSQTHQMTISTGVAAVAEARYRRMDAALGYIRQIAGTRLLRFPGAPSEMSPAGGCFVQAWTGYGVAVPIVRHFLGLEPLAHQKRIRLSPCLPAAWDWARLDAVRVGDQRLDLAVAVDRTAGEVRVEIHGLDPDWTVDVEIAPAWYGLPAGRYVLEVNGEVRVSGGSGPLSANWRSRGRDHIALKPAEKGGAAR